MATLVDGLGGEELQDTSGFGDVGSKDVALWITGSITTQDTINAAGTISGAGTMYILALSGTNVFASDNVIGSGVSSAEGGIQSVNYGADAAGSPSVFGAFIQAGRAGPLIAATGSIVFGKAFTTDDYIITISPESPIVDGLGSIIPIVTSGNLLHSVSGCTFAAQSGGKYVWTAIGI